MNYSLCFKISKSSRVIYSKQTDNHKNTFFISGADVIYGGKGAGAKGLIDLLML